MKKIILDYSNINENDLCQIIMSSKELEFNLLTNYPLKIMFDFNLKYCK